MTETVDTANSPDANPEVRDAEQNDTGSKPAREAAKYRRQLRDVEAERDTLKQEFAQARGKLLEQALDQRFLSVLTLSGHDSSTLFTDAGELDEEALQQVGDELNAKYPGMIDERRGEWRGLDEAPPLQLLKDHRVGAAAPHDPDEGRSPSALPTANRWEGAFKPQQ